MPKLSFRWLIVVTLLGIVSQTLGSGQRAMAAEPAYISIMISRATSQEADAKCVPYPGTVKISDVAAGLASHGIKTVVGSLVVDWANIAETGGCIPWFDSDGVRRGQTTAAGWTQAGALRDQRGWKFVSHSKSYANLATLTDPAQRRAETCDTLKTFAAHGHKDAFGMFNFPNNQTTSVVSDLVDSCFTYGRRYGTSVNTRATTSLAPHTMWSQSVSGGRCNNVALACYTANVVKDRRYTLPSAVAATLRPAAGQYGIAQFYRFVSGKRSASTGPTWDCSSSDPKDHFTSAPETYCINDLWTALAGRSKTAIVTHPAAVARAWGRTL
jgi:hypothetical protein